MLQYRDECEPCFARCNGANHDVSSRDAATTGENNIARKRFPEASELLDHTYLNHAFYIDTCMTELKLLWEPSVLVAYLGTRGAEETTTKNGSILKGMDLLTKDINLAPLF